MTESCAHSLNAARIFDESSRPSVCSTMHSFAEASVKRRTARRPESGVRRLGTILAKGFGSQHVEVRFYSTTSTERAFCTSSGKAVEVYFVSTSEGKEVTRQPPSPYRL